MRRLFVLYVTVHPRFSIKLALPTLKTVFVALVQGGLPCAGPWAKALGEQRLRPEPGRPKTAAEPGFVICCVQPRTANIMTCDCPWLSRLLFRSNCKSPCTAKPFLVQLPARLALCPKQLASRSCSSCSRP